MSKSGSPPKRRKKRLARKAKADQPEDRGMTANGRQIKTFMASTKAKGSWKDYVLFVGPQMLDAWGTYQFQRADTNKAAGVPEATVFLLHKSKLHMVIGDVNAKLFWNAPLRRRTALGKPKRVLARRG